MEIILIIYKIIFVLHFLMEFEQIFDELIILFCSEFEALQLCCTWYTHENDYF